MEVSESLQGSGSGGIFTGFCVCVCVCVCVCLFFFQNLEAGVKDCFACFM
jgi:hypothetical protein